MRFSFVALGDMPYEARDQGPFAALIAEVNRLAPRFSVHVGDVKSAKSPCDAACYRRVLEHFRSFDQPLIYTPGDNDWADCHKSEAGGFDPLDRLADLRRRFFATDRSLGREPFDLRRQDGGAAGPAMVENARWQVGNTLFLTVHITGDNNNLGRAARTDRESRLRDDANLRWIEEGFDIAVGAGLDGLVLLTHANLWVERDRRPGKRYKDKHQQPGFRQTIKAIRRGARAFDRPVLVVHGDKHRLLIDQPLTVSKTAERPLDGVIRLQVMGGEQINAVVVTVDPSTAPLFSFRPLLA